MTTSSTSALDDAYFAEYADPRTHKSMLLDDQRVLAYARAINDGSLAGQTVLDVGCGMTALLSVLCARAGAKRVYAVEACRAACRLARRVVRDNGLEHVIHIVEGRIEDERLLRTRSRGADGYVQVDAIVSEWMGACLFHEGMLPAVLRARDRHLKPGGRMLPSGATLFLAPVEDRSTWEGQVGTWSNESTASREGRGVHGNMGINLESIAAEAKQSAFGHPWSRCLHPEQLLSSQPQPIGSWNLHTLPLEAVAHGKLLSRASFRFGSDSGMRAGNPRPRRRTLHGFAVWFDVTFEPPRTQRPTQTVSTLTRIIRLSTGLNPPSQLPEQQTQNRLACGADVTTRDTHRNQGEIVFGGKATNHWGQTIFYTQNPLPFDGDSQQLHGTISIVPQLSPAQQREQRRNEHGEDEDDSPGDYCWRFLSVHLKWDVRNNDQRSNHDNGTCAGIHHSGNLDGNTGIQPGKQPTRKRKYANSDSTDSYDNSAEFTTAQMEYAEPCTVYSFKQPMQ